jgi:hypothetical protein
MKRAKSLVDSTDWDVTEFARQNPERRDKHRGKLQCLGCAQPAVFKMGSGKRRPFFAANHRRNCDLIKGPWSVFRYLQ